MLSVVKSRCIECEAEARAACIREAAPDCSDVRAIQPVDGLSYFTPVNYYFDCCDADIIERPPAACCSVVERRAEVWRFEVAKRRELVCGLDQNSKRARDRLLRGISYSDDEDAS